MRSTHLALKGEAFLTHGILCKNFTNCEIITHFDDLEFYLCNYIKQYPIILGCVAWLTNENILKALQSREQVQIIVQKEDFLRPDSHKLPDLSGLYDALPYGLSGCGDEFTLDLNCCFSLNTQGMWNCKAIRCVGNLNSDKYKINPRMHNKFIVFCDSKIIVKKDSFYDWQTKTIIPRAVWTGSFNFTHNAVNSFENAVFIKDERVATEYLNMFQRIFALSEELNWNIEWTPEFRIGS